MNSKKTSQNIAISAFDEQTFRRIFEGHSAVMWLIEPQTGAILDVNQAAVDFYGYSRSKLCSMFVGEINTLPPEQVTAEQQRALKEERNYFVFPHRLAGGEERIVEVHSSPIALQEKQVLFSIIHDITERKQAEEALKASKLLFHLLIESLPQNIYAKDIDGRFVFANQHYCATQGKALEEIVGKTDFELHPPELAEKYHMDDFRVIETGKTIELVEEHQPVGEKKFFVQVIKTPFNDSKGQTAGTLGIFWDITKHKQEEIELHYMKENLNAANIELQAALICEQQLARTDSLTGINTRRHLLELAEHEFNVAIRYRPPLSVLMFDVDHFKQINDTFGHAVGDQMLQGIVQIVCAEIRSVDVFGRYGGDEFIVLLPQTSAQEVLPLAERICAKVASLRIETDKGPLTITLSLGIAQTIHHDVLELGYIPQPDSVEDLFLRADRALYEAKQSGRNCTIIFAEE